ncbi:MAG: hypothetical protein OEX22_06030 [Cyclobacteriaceae bacterium]|nr:hypothetical protein [Cyclobacteriaceae bacterium]
MFSRLNTKEGEIANDIISKGLSKAALSLEQIIQSKVELNPINVTYDKIDAIFQYTKKNDAKTHLLKTEIKGEIKGICYLVFTIDEINKIHQKCLPTKILESQSLNDMMMKGAILKEIDNMLSAAVITEFANRLKVDIYGDVPNLKVVKENTINSIIDEEAEEHECFVNFRTIMHAEELDISADFIWLMDDDFIDSIKFSVSQINV